MDGSGLRDRPADHDRSCADIDYIIAVLSACTIVVPCGMGRMWWERGTNRMCRCGSG
jgi:hypothetical protein